MMACKLKIVIAMATLVLYAGVINKRPLIINIKPKSKRKYFGSTPKPKNKKVKLQARMKPK